ncbi:hypothetical protein ACKWTF_013257 [Chironomus riparius]
MNRTLLAVSSCLLLTLVSVLLAAKPKQNLLDIPRFKTFSCVFSKDFRQQFYPNSTCNMTKLNRQTTALNFNVHLCNPTEHIFLQLILLYKTSDGSFREVIKSPEFDYCLLESTHFDGFLLEQLTELFRKVIAKGTYKCPLSVISFWNITLPAHKLFSYLPSGLFKIIVPIRYDDKGPNSFNVTGTFQFESFKEKLGN